MVYVAAPKGKVVAFDDACVSDCSPVWRTARRNGGPAAAGDGYVFVVRGGTLSAFAATCGTGGANCEPAWTADVSLYGSLTVSDGLLVLSSIPTASAGDLTAFPAACTTGGATCDPLWTAPDLVDPVIAGGVVYAVGRDGHQLFAFDERCGTGGETCRPLWTGSTHGIIRTAPVVDGGGVYVGTGDSKVVAFRLGAGGTAGSGSPLPITTILVLVVLAAGGVVIVLRRRARALARETL